MNATHDLGRLAQMLGTRLLLVLMLAVAVSGATYAVAVSPVGVAMSSNVRRPPGRPADATTQTAAPAATAAAPVTTSDVPVAGQAQAAQAQATQAQAQRPPGGGRGPSLTQGLPELGMHALVVGVIVLALNGARSLWLIYQRRRGGNRAPVFRHAAAGQ